MIATSLWTALCVALAAAPAAPAPAEAPPKSEGAAAADPTAALPAPLKGFATAKKKDGTPQLTAEQLRFLGTLPERTKKQLSDAIDGQLLGSAEQLANLMTLELSPQAYEIVATDNCILCHTDPNNVKAKSLFAPDPALQKSNHLLNLKELVSDVHFRRGLSCAGCHGGKPTDEVMSDEIGKRWPSEEVRHKDRGWIPDFCARCHSDPGFMRGFNPALPTDQLAKYKTSKHGQLLLEQKDSRAAQCISCHSVHGIRNAKSRKSTVHPQQVPETCGKCHADAKYMAGMTRDDGTPMPTNQLADYKSSVHGKALLEKGDLGAPACNSCHGNHAAMPPAVASVAQVCRRCHTQNGAFFDGSRHKQKFEEHKWPECGQCHDHHAIQKPTEALLENHKGALCFDCHAKYSKDNPICQKTASHFHDVITEIGAGRAALAPLAETLAEKGLDTEPLGRTLSELDEATVSTRSSIHHFEAAAFDDSARPALLALQKGRAQVAEANAEHTVRSRGLLAAMAAMAVLALALGLKLRALDRRRKKEDGA